MVVSEFSNFTIADINLIFWRAKMGEWGEFYGRLDGQMILSWCSKYLEERCNWFSEQSCIETARETPRIQDTPERIQREISKLVVENKQKIK